MKNLDVVKQILRIKIVIDKMKGTLHFSETGHVKRASSKFNLGTDKPMSTALTCNIKLSKE